MPRFADIGVEEKRVPLAKITNPIDHAAPGTAKVEALAALSKSNEPQLRAVAEKIDVQLGVRTDVHCKQPERIRAKAARPEIRRTRSWFDVEHIRDALRFRTAIRQLDDVCEAFDLVLKAALTVVKVDLDKMIDPDLWGWRVAVFDLRMPDRQLTEYYLALVEVMEANDRVCHALFERWRNRTREELIRDWVQYQQDIEMSNTTYGIAWDAAIIRLGMNRQNAVLAWKRVRAEFPPRGSA